MSRVDVSDKIRSLTETVDEPSIHLHARSSRAFSMQIYKLAHHAVASRHARVLLRPLLLRFTFSGLCLPHLIRHLFLRNVDP